MKRALVLLAAAALAVLLAAGLAVALVLIREDARAARGRLGKGPLPAGVAARPCLCPGGPGGCKGGPEQCCGKDDCRCPPPSH